jgi:hypothetical protein
LKPGNFTQDVAVVFLVLPLDSGAKNTKTTSSTITRSTSGSNHPSLGFIPAENHPQMNPNAIANPTAKETVARCDQTLRSVSET